MARGMCPTPDPPTHQLASSVVYFVAYSQLKPHTHMGHSSASARVSFGGLTGSVAADGTAEGAAEPSALPPVSEYVESFAVDGGVTLEAAIAPF